MFCKYCGAEMSEDAKFCSRCGKERISNQTQNKEIIEDNEIVFQLKPEFNILYKILTNFNRALLYLLLIVCIFKGLFMMWIYYPKTILVTLGIIAVYVAIKMIFEKKQYENTEYNFYKTKIQYKDGFLNKEEKELKYKYIRETIMAQNILEKFCGIGKIKIYTSASSGYSTKDNHNTMRGRNGIFIHCVSDVKEQYKIIKQIIDEGT